MTAIDFKVLFDTLKMPVLVCRRVEGLPVLFINAEARLLLAPSLSIQMLKGEVEFGDLTRLMVFEDPNASVDFGQGVLKAGVMGGYRTTILSYERKPLSVILNANTAKFGEEEYVVVYIVAVDRAAQAEEGLTEELLSGILREAYHEKDLDQTIRSIISLAGRRSKVSRVYIFEDISPEATRNTYEWCAAGVEPAIHLLQNLRKEDYNYDVIMSTSMYIYNDTRTLPQRDREILLDMQGIKSIAILALYQQDQPLGYIGFDDTVNYRVWTRHEIQILEGIASIVSTLICRRNIERDLENNRGVVQTITDNLEDLIFVTDLETYELKFVSQSLCKAQGMEARELLGRPCWEVLHLGQSGPCSFCPIPGLFDASGRPRRESAVWEYQSDISGKWYLAKDNIIKWTDGKLVHLETAVDITYRKQYEEQLKYSATTDAMTEVFNREWGRKRLLDMASGADGSPETPKTLCFIDIDGLKAVNDRLGHATGDELIVNTIRTIFACIRKEDFICRWGGDEFLLVLRCGLSVARKVMDKIRFALEHFNATAGKNYRLSISHGEVAIPTDGSADIDAIINLADKEMYRNKIAKKAARRSTRLFWRKD